MKERLEARMQVSRISRGCARFAPPARLKMAIPASQAGVELRSRLLTPMR
jgi:hypothetical protein